MNKLIVDHITNVVLDRQEAGATVEEVVTQTPDEFEKILEALEFDVAGWGTTNTTVYGSRVNGELDALSTVVVEER